MRHVDWNSVTATDDGTFQQIPAGGYVVRITDVEDKESKQYVELVFDIAEGEHKGFYADAWGLAHPYAHHIFLSYKDSALGMLKGRLESIQASNAGFDAFAAWDAGRIDLFVDRLVGVNLQEEEYERNDGSVGTRINVCQVVDAQKVRDGLVKVREKKTLDGKKPTGAKSTEKKYDTSDIDLPFD